MYGDQIKTVSNYWGVYTNDWFLSNNVNAYDVNHLCYIEDIYEGGIIQNTITGKLDVKSDLEGLSLSILGNYSKVKVFGCVSYPIHGGFSIIFDADVFIQKSPLF